MAQNTAMQILFDELEKLGENYSESFKGFHLSNERKNIEDAGSKCQIVNDVSFDGDIDFMYKSGSDYFTQTFTQNK